MSDQVTFSRHVQQIRELVSRAMTAATGNSCTIPLQGLSLRAADTVADEMNRRDNRVRAEVRNNNLVITW